MTAGSAAAASGGRDGTAAKIAQRGDFCQDPGTTLLRLFQGIGHGKTPPCTQRLGFIWWRFLRKAMKAFAGLATSPAAAAVKTLI
jgi:hypothetical protein